MKLGSLQGRFWGSVCKSTCCYEVILSVLTSESGHPYCLFTSSSLVSLTLHLGVRLFLPRVVTHWIFLSVCSFDGVPFLMHDSTLKRTTNIAEVFPNRSHLDASMFTWTELQQLNAGDWFLSVWPARTQLNTEQQQHVVGLEMHHLYRNYWKKHIPTDI